MAESSVEDRMIEEGVVIEVFDGKARVRAMRGTSCNGCASRPMCKPIEGPNVVIEAKNSIGAHVDERVEVAMQAKTFLTASFIVYIIPLMGFVIGGAVGKRIGGTDAWAALCGIGSMLLCYGGIWMYNKKAQKEGKYQPEIVTVLSS